jgi:hypothetical protein
MKYNKELKLLKENLEVCLCSDDLEVCLWYLEEYEKLLEYKEAFYYFLEYWGSLDKQQHKGINKALNRIFKLNKEERIK